FIDAAPLVLDDAYRLTQGTVIPDGKRAHTSSPVVGDIDKPTQRIDAHMSRSAPSGRLDIEKGEFSRLLVDPVGGNSAMITVGVHPSGDRVEELPVGMDPVETTRPFRHGLDRMELPGIPVKFKNDQPITRSDVENLLFGLHCRAPGPQNENREKEQQVSRLMEHVRFSVLILLSEFRFPGEERRGSTPPQISEECPPNAPRRICRYP